VRRNIAAKVTVIKVVQVLTVENGRQRMTKHVDIR